MWKQLEVSAKVLASTEVLHERTLQYLDRVNTEIPE